MRSSKKILVTVAGVVIALFVVGLMVLRQDATTLLRKAELANKYREFPVDKFEKLSFTGNWEVKVKQGRTHKVEIEIEDGSDFSPRLTQTNNALYFTIEGDTAEAKPLTTRARITAPWLLDIKADGKSQIAIEDFDSDTLYVELENGATFAGKNNYFTHLSFKTVGNSFVQLIDNVQN